MGVKGYITFDNRYYEAEEPKSPHDVEIPIRPNAKFIWNGSNWDNERRKLFSQAIEELDRENQSKEEDHDHDSRPPQSLRMKLNGLHFGLKDIITVGYFVASIVGLWLHMSERILIAEQRLNVAEKEVAALQIKSEEDQRFFNEQLKGLEAQVSEISLLLLRKNQ